MRKIVFTICIVLISINLIGQVSFDFTIHTVSTTNSITCTNTSVDCKARSNSPETATYSWIGALITYTGEIVSITIPGTYSVYASTPSGQNLLKTINIGVDMLYPISNLNPIVQSISCNNASLAQITASSTGGGVNLSHHFISPFGGSYVANTSTTSYAPSVPGTYTHVLINTDNGCATTKTFVVNSSAGFPTFNVSSASNFTLGCGTSSVTSISITGAVTAPPLGGAVSYSILSSQTSSNLVFGNLSQNTTYTINSPGNYTLVTRDNLSLCDTRVAVSVIQNTIQPDLSVFVPTQILDCNTNQVKLEVLSFVSNVSYHWFWPGNSSGSYTNDNMIVSTTPQISNSVVSVYTVIAKNPSNQCTTNTIIPIYQNLYKPNPNIGASSNKLTCNQPSIVLTNQSSTGIPLNSLFNVNQPVVSYWKSPLTLNSVMSSTFIATTSGYYKLEAIDKNNGCKSSTTMPVFNEKVYPMVNIPVVPAPFCINTISTSVFVYPIITQNTSNFVYQWTGPPTAAISAANGFSYSANALGIYSVVVTNTLNGCSSLGQVIVANCYTDLSENVLNATTVSIYPNPSNALFTIDCHDFENNAMIKIYNALGMLVNEQTLSSPSTLIDLYAQPKGIYTVYVIQKNKRSISAKLIKN